MSESISKSISKRAKANQQNTNKKRRNKQSQNFFQTKKVQNIVQNILQNKIEQEINLLNYKLEQSKKSLDLLEKRHSLSQCEFFKFKNYRLYLQMQRMWKKMHKVKK